MLHQEKKRKMSEILFAQVIFDDQRNKKVIRSIEDIRFAKHDKQSIKPQHNQDFNEKHKYYVKYLYCSEDGINCLEAHEHEVEYCRAFINFLGCKWNYYYDSRKQMISIINFILISQIHRFSARN